MIAWFVASQENLPVPIAAPQVRHAPVEHAQPGERLPVGVAAGW